MQRKEEWIPIYNSPSEDLIVYFLHEINEDYGD